MLGGIVLPKEEDWCELDRETALNVDLTQGTEGEAVEGAIHGDADALCAHLPRVCPVASQYFRSGMRFSAKDYR